MTKKGIAVVLSGGAARGVAHLGVLKALEEAAIKPAAISGVSAGAIVGAYYCNGYSPEHILELIKSIPILRKLRPTRSTGLLKLDKAEEIFRKHLKSDVFENLETPLFITATDVDKAEIITFSKGELIPPLLGSASFPLFFRPVEFNGRRLVDGGIINNLPVDPVCDYEKVIGVNVNIVKPHPDNFTQYVEWVVTVVVNNNIQEEIKKCDIFIQPPAMVNFKITEIGKADEIFRTGYEYVKNNIESILT